MIKPKPDEPPKPELLCHIEAFRLTQRLTQQQLADKAGVSRKTVYAVETGRTAPSIEVALRLAKALDQPVDKLFSLRYVTRPVISRRRRRIKTYSQPWPAIPTDYWL